jgi:hypothetical protein
MTDMTYIIAPGPGLVCHHVCKYKREMTNTWALQLLACCLLGAAAAYLVA